MNVSLHPELQAFVDQQIQAGNYESASDMINAGLLLLRDSEELMPTDPEELAELRRKIQEGIDSLDRGEGAEWNSEEVKAQGRRQLAEKRRAAN